MAQIPQVTWEQHMPQVNHEQHTPNGQPEPAARKPAAVEISEPVVAEIAKVAPVEDPPVFTVQATGWGELSRAITAAAEANTVKEPLTELPEVAEKPVTPVEVMAPRHAKRHVIPAAPAAAPAAIAAPAAEPVQVSTPKAPTNTRRATRRQ